ncbi:UNKNOWN [Stylonychia lemnae]|uniref:Uncharacterized protein n=1 Tax=Stylonychia lemnae TaxID=5949 RepID=A0A078B174_STYLE|nr:UNKNOWN [Stylonychia lemnae]|eukprot:CDW87107.1 UNKNOWN [Stylonychia lemnae]
MQSAGRPEIPLREPIDQDFKNNRKMAKQLYNQERVEKVKQNKEFHQQMIDQQMDALLKREKKKEKQLEDERKQLEKDQKIIREQNERKRQQVLEMKKKLLKDKEKELKDQEKKVQDQYDKYISEKDERMKRQQEELFQLDLEQMKEIKDKHGAIQQKIRREQEEVEIQLKVIEEKLNIKEKAKIEKLIKKQEDLKIHSEIVSTRLNHVKELSTSINAELIQRDLEKMSKTVKNKEEKIKKDIIDLKVKNQRKFENIELKQKDIQRRTREQFNYYQQKNNLRDQLITDVKEALKEDVEKKKELSLLRKMDQEENFMRSQNFHNMYKQKLQEKLSEKKDRAERIKEQQKRIADMCGTVRTIDPFRSVISGAGNQMANKTVTHLRTKSVGINF